MPMLVSLGWFLTWKANATGFHMIMTRVTLQTIWRLRLWLNVCKMVPRRGLMEATWVRFISESVLITVSPWNLFRLRKNATVGMRLAKSELCWSRRKKVIGIRLVQRAPQLNFLMRRKVVTWLLSSSTRLMTEKWMAPLVMMRLMKWFWIVGNINSKTLAALER